MKERPILFSAPMVRAILDGRKTQTRRTVKIQHPLDLPNYYATGRTLCELENQPGAFMEFRHTSQDEVGFTGSPAAFLLRCPYGQTGDRLWVRETFRLFDATDECGCYECPCGCPPTGTPIYRADCDYGESKWRPSIYMPRWASRILLEITDVRVERLQDISEEDAASEGAPCEIGRLEATILGTQASYRKGFIRLWESINGEGSWIENPWVWVIEFKRINQQTEGE